MLPCSRFHREALLTKHFKTQTDTQHFNYRNVSDKLSQKGLFTFCYLKKFRHKDQLSCFSPTIQGYLNWTVSLWFANKDLRKPPLLVSLPSPIIIHTSL